VTAPHVVHTWPLRGTVGSIDGDALTLFAFSVIATVPTLTRPQSIATNGSNRPNSQTWHRLAVWTVGALVAGIRSKPRV